MCAMVRGSRLACRSDSRNMYHFVSIDVKKVALYYNHGRFDYPLDQQFRALIVYH
jgi:hypothetical protein